MKVMGIPVGRIGSGRLAQAIPRRFPLEGCPMQVMISYVGYAFLASLIPS